MLAAKWTASQIIFALIGLRHSWRTGLRNAGSDAAIGENYLVALKEPERHAGVAPLQRPAELSRLDAEGI